MIEAMQYIRSITGNRTVEDLSKNRISQLALERSFEILSEASRHMPDDMKARFPDIPWRKVAGIGNVLRHEYADVAPRLLYEIVREHLSALEQSCLTELTRLRQATK
jgi:uncharacterized protein with HEPN domain